jgi:hypothetical protein
MVHVQCQDASFLQRWMKILNPLLGCSFRNVIEYCTKRVCDGGMQQYAAVGTTSQRKIHVKVISRVQLNILPFSTDGTIRTLSIDTMVSQSLRVVGGRWRSLESSN